MSADTWIKICGVTSVEDARTVADAGANAIGINFVASSPRRVDLRRGREIADAVRGRLEIVVVAADLPDDEIGEIVRGVDPDSVQLHGAESEDDCQRVLDRFDTPVLKAIRLATRADLEAALVYREGLLIDAGGPGAFGGTGRLANWDLAAELVRSRPHTTLAGGLRPDNVAAAIAHVQPFGVDVASGVERAPGVKDPELVQRFVRAARVTSPRAGGHLP